MRPHGETGIWYNANIIMRVYLDNCCRNRPFDEQKSLRVRMGMEGMK